MIQSERISDCRGQRMYNYTPVEELKKLCEKRDIWAMNELAHRYESGEGVERDSKESRILYTIAAENGNGMVKAKLLYDRMAGRKEEYRKEAEALCRSGNYTALLLYYTEYGIDYYRKLDNSEFREFLDVLISEGLSVYIYNMFLKRSLTKGEMRQFLPEVENNIDRLCLMSLEALYEMYQYCGYRHDMDRVSAMIVDAAKANYSGMARIPGRVSLPNICRMGLIESTRPKLESLMDIIDNDYQKDNDRYGLAACDIAESFMILGNTEKAKQYALRALSKGCPIVKDNLVDLLPKERIIEECIRNAEEEPLLYGTLMKYTEGEERLKYAKLGAKKSDVRCLRVLQNKYESEGNMNMAIACMLRNALETPTEEMLSAIIRRYPELEELYGFKDTIAKYLVTDTPLRSMMLDLYPLEF